MAAVKHIVRFGKVKYHNFMSFADQEWNFSSPGEMFLISGRNNDKNLPATGIDASNGSGKTNLVQGLMFALYGQFPYKVHNSNLVNLYCKALDAEGYAMSVSLELEINSDKYKVVRGAPKRATASLQVSLYKEVDGEWEDVSKSSAALTQAHIESMLHLDMQSFQRLVMLSLDPTFNFYKMNASQKRDLIQALFDTSIYSSMWELIKKDIARYELSLQNEKVKWNVLQGQLVDCEAKIKEYAKGAKEQQKEIDAQIHELMNTTLQTIESSRTEAKKLLNEWKVKLDDVLKKSEDAMDQSSRLRARLSGGNQAIAGVKDKLVSYQKEIAKHHGILSLICDDCAKKVRDAYKLDEYESGIEDCNKKLQVFTTEVEKIQKALDEFQDKLMAFGDERMRMERECKNIESQIVTLDMDEAQAKSRVEFLKQRKEEIERSMKDPRSLPMLDTYKALKRDISSSEGEVKKHEGELTWLQLCEGAVSPDGIRKNIVSRVVKNINDFINRNLGELNTSIQVEIDDQLDKYTILAPGGKGIDYHNLSKGEQMKLVLATQLAFRRFLYMRLGVSCNCLILDEIVDQNFDTLSVSRILNMLLEMAKHESSHIYIISHRCEVSDLLDDLIDSDPEAKTAVHRILVEKNNHISTITAVE